MYVKSQEKLLQASNFCEQYGEALSYNICFLWQRTYIARHISSLVKNISSALWKRESHGNKEVEENCRSIQISE